MEKGELIVGVLSILSGFIAIWINEFLTHKREIKHRKDELLLSHLKETLEWLNGMQCDILNISRVLADVVEIHNLDKKKELIKIFSDEANEIIEKSIIFCGSYAEINSSLGIDLELKELNKSVGRYVRELRNIQKEPAVSDKDNLETINRKTEAIEEDIRKRVCIISGEISKLLR